MFTPIWGYDPIWLYNVSQMGWFNHQLERNDHWARNVLRMFPLFGVSFQKGINPIQSYRIRMGFLVYQWNSRAGGVWILRLLCVFCCWNDLLIDTPKKNSNIEPNKIRISKKDFSFSKGLFSGSMLTGVYLEVSVTLPADSNLRSFHSPPFGDVVNACKTSSYVTMVQQRNPPFCSKQNCKTYPPKN